MLTFDLMYLVMDWCSWPTFVQKKIRITRPKMTNRRPLQIAWESIHCTRIVHIDYNLMYYFCIILLSDPSHKIIITNLRQTLNCEEHEMGRFTDFSSLVPYRPIPSFPFQCCCMLGVSGLARG